MRTIPIWMWALAACSASTPLSLDAGTDAARIDVGTGVDPCVTDLAHAASTIGCNGPPPGAAIPDDATGGRCVLDPSSIEDMPLPLRGSCASPDDLCAGHPGLGGICLRRCEPAPTYVSTSTCPSGSRCFTIDLLRGAVVCYPDCYTGSDCVWGICDQDGSCECEGCGADAGVPGADAG